MKSLQEISRSSTPHWVGNGFPVRSVFDYRGLGRRLNPFLVLDYAPPHVFPAGLEKRGVEAHPHKGFETVTIVFEGELEHRDSSGAGGKIGPGDVQWMTAGSGIIHEEFHSDEFVESGGVLHMIQLWVNLPAKDKGSEPSYQTILNRDIPHVGLEDGLADVRIIAGQIGDVRGPARTFTPINLWDVRAGNGYVGRLPIPAGQLCAILVVSGRLSFGRGEEAAAAELAIFDREEEGIQVESMADSQFVVLAGEPIDEPYVAHGPFVMSTQEEIRAAFLQYNRGEMGRIA